MKVAVEKLDKGRVKLNIEIPAEEVKQELDQQYQKIRKSVAIPGFRKGKAPLNMVKARFSGYVQADVLQKLIPTAYDNAIRDEELTPLGEVDIQPPYDQLELVEDQGFTFSALVNVKPEILLPDYSDFQIDKSSVNVSKEDVDQRMKQLREIHTDYIPIEEERTVREGDCVNMSWQSFLDGEQGESEADADIDIGSSNIFPEIKEALIDMQPGEAKAVDIDTSQSQERQPDDPLEGREVHIEFTLNTITQKQLPELDDEFARDLDHENYDQFYATIWNEMVEEEKNEQYRRQQAEIRQQVVEKVEIEVPESLIERYVQESLTNIHAQLEQEGRTAEEAEIDLEEMPNQLHQSFVADTKSTWFFDEVSAREEIEMTDDELDIEIRRIAERQDRDPQKYASLLKASNRVEEFRRQMRDEKIYRYLIEHASEKESLIITPS